MLRLWNRVRSQIQLRFVWWLLTGFGILLRLRQYLANRSLWADEASLALNIVHRSFSELTAPLDGSQGAPIGFLLIEKFFIIMLGNADYVLRLFPLLCGLAAVYLIYRISSETLGTFGLFSLFMFAINGHFIYYSSEVKQYEVDIAIALSILFYSYRLLKNDAKRVDFWGLAILGILSMWLSHPSVFILAGVGLLLLYRRLQNQSSYPLIWLLAVGAAWTINLWIIYSISVQQLAANSYLQTFWRNDFMPLPPWRHWGWFAIAYQKLLSVITGVFRPIPWTVLLPCSAAMLFGLAPDLSNSQNRFTTSLTLIVVPLMLVASALHLYPVFGRFLLFLAPFIYLLMANGLKRIYSMVARWNWASSLVLVLVLMGAIAWKPAVAAIQDFITPPMGEHIKQALNYLQQHKNENDIVYVYYGGFSAFEYYRTSFDVDPAYVVRGVMSRDDPQKYLEDIDKLKGQDRVWFLFTHNCDTCVVHEQKYYLRYLNKIGTTLDKFHGAGVNLYLYDLNP